MSDLDVLVGRRIVAVEDGRGPVSADWVTLVLDDGTRVDFSTDSDGNYYRDDLVIELILPLPAVPVIHAVAEPAE
jgi:hypothetical protein